MMGMGEKNPKYKKRKQGPPPFGLSSHPSFYEMEADCFPVPEDTENKPDLP